MAQAGLPHVSPHACRHTYATHLVEAGVPIAHVAQLLGDTIARAVAHTLNHTPRNRGFDAQPTIVMPGSFGNWASDTGPAEGLTA